MGRFEMLDDFNTTGFTDADWTELKLVRYLPWLRRHPFNGMPEVSDAFEAMHRWWIYFGTIPPEKITEGLTNT